MDHQLLLLAHVLRPQRRLGGLNLGCPLCQPPVLLRFAADTYQRCLGGTATREELSLLQNEVRPSPSPRPSLPPSPTHVALRAQLFDYLFRERIFAVEEEGEGAGESALGFWRRWQTEAPHLAALAIRLLGVVPHCAPVDRWWSHASTLLLHIRGSEAGERRVKMALVRAQPGGELGADYVLPQPAASPWENGEGRPAEGEATAAEEEAPEDSYTDLAHDWAEEAHAILQRWGWLSEERTPDPQAPEGAHRSKTCDLKQVFATDTAFLHPP